MSLIIKESFNKFYCKFNKLKKNGFDKLYNFFQKKNFCETQSNQDIIVKDDNNTSEYYSDISDDESESDLDNNIRRCDSFFDEQPLYYDENGCPFDSFNLANWDGDQQVGFRE